MQKLDVREIKPYLEKIRVVLVKRGDKNPQFMFETMGLDETFYCTWTGNGFEGDLNRKFYLKISGGNKKR